MRRQPTKRPAAQKRRSAGQPPKRPASNDAILYEDRRLVHELEVHQIELEVQNRALRDAQEVLEESRARYAALYDYAPVGHVTLDREGVIRELNLACAALLGKERRLLVGKPLRLLLTAEGAAALDAHLRASFDARRAVSCELTIPLADAQRRTVEVVTIPPPASARARVDGAAVFHSTLIDVSERKRDDERLEALLRREHEARLLAETLNRVKQEFLTIVSHELRSPLAPMLLWVRALRAGGMSDALRARAVEAIDSCIKVQVAMIDDLIDVARGHQGTLRIDRRPMDLTPVVAAALETMAPSAAAKQIELRLDVPPEPLWVAGDATRLQQVVTNLLTNAIKFTREAGHVVVSLRAHDADVVLTVRDDGEGIDRARLRGIFEPFPRRAPEDERHSGGLGLGLTIVRQLIDQHDGRVTAASDGKGRGACFTVSLPRLDEGVRGWPPDLAEAPPAESD